MMSAAITIILVCAAIFAVVIVGAMGLLIFGLITDSREDERR